jgi:hypothetical protein
MNLGTDAAQRSAPLASRHRELKQLPFTESIETVQRSSRGVAAQRVRPECPHAGLNPLHPGRRRSADAVDASREILDDAPMGE